MGLLHMDDHGNPHFVYDRQWLASADAFPLSISLPLNRPTHPSATVGAVIWGLLPDNDTILQGWGSRFHVSPATRWPCWPMWAKTAQGPCSS